MIKWLIDILFGWVPYVPKAIWRMLTFEHKRSWSHLLRAFGLFILGTWIIIWGNITYSENKDFTFLYPKYETLKIDSGYLKYMQYGKRQFDLTLLKSDGINIHFKRQNDSFSGLDSWYKRENGYWDYDKQFLVKIRWFTLPSGMAWIAELEKNGKIVVSYTKGRKDFYTVKKHNEKWALYTFWLPFLILILIIFFEASALRKYAKQGKNISW